jgi:hypothetical protein
VEKVFLLFTPSFLLFLLSFFDSFVKFERRIFFRGLLRSVKGFFFFLGLQLSFLLYFSFISLGLQVYDFSQVFFFFGGLFKFNSLPEGLQKTIYFWGLVDFEGGVCIRFC